MTDEATVTGPTITGSIPNAQGEVSGTLRISAVVDLVYVDGALESVGFNAAQYTVFESGKTLSVKSAFPKTGK